MLWVYQTCEGPAKHVAVLLKAHLECRGSTRVAVVFAADGLPGMRRQQFLAVQLCSSTPVGLAGELLGK